MNESSSQTSLSRDVKVCCVPSTHTIVMALEDPTDLASTQNSRSVVKEFSQEIVIAYTEDRMVGCSIPKRSTHVLVIHVHR